MRRLLHNKFSLLFLAMFIFGCATVSTKPTVEKDPFHQFPERYRSKAMAYEKRGDLRKALQSWEIVSSFNPEDKRVAKRIAEIKVQIHAITARHFKKGLSYYKRNSIRAARKEFLLVLSYNPDHKAALSYIKNKLAGEDSLYEVKAGDTLKSIAKKSYNDPQKDFLIAYLNDIDKDAKLSPGTTLKLPILETAPIRSKIVTKEIPLVKPEFALKETLSKANNSFKAKKHQKAVSLAEEVLIHEPANREAIGLINASYYHMGKKLIREKNYQEALTTFGLVEPGYKDVMKSIAFVKSRLAEAHYVRGVEYFINEDLDRAIKEWKTTLNLNPNHNKAKKDIENARSLLEMLKEVR